MELFPEQIPSSGSFHFFFSSYFQHLFADLSVLCVASQCSLCWPPWGPCALRGQAWGQGQAAHPGAFPWQLWERKPICVCEWEWPWGKILERTGWPVLLLSRRLSLQNLTAPDRGYCAVELLLDGVQAEKWGRSNSTGWFNSSVGCKFWLVTGAGEPGDGVGSSRAVPGST